MALDLSGAGADAETLRSALSSVLQETTKLDHAFAQVRREIIGTTKVTKDMENTFLSKLSKSKGWTAFSRFLSGTPLWKFQNKIHIIS